MKCCIILVWYLISKIGCLTVKSQLPDVVPAWQVLAEGNLRNFPKHRSGRPLALLPNQGNKAGTHHYNSDRCWTKGTGWKRWIQSLHWELLCRLSVAWRPSLLATRQVALLDWDVSKETSFSTQRRAAGWGGQRQNCKAIPVLCCP